MRRESEDRTSGDQTSVGPTPEGQTPEGPTPEGQAPEGKAAEGQAPEEPAAEEPAAEGEATGDQAAGGEAAAGQGPGGRRILPVADSARVRAYARTLLRRHRRPLSRALVLHALAAVCGLAAPWLLGGLVEDVVHGAPLSTVDRVALAIAGFVAAQAVLLRFAAYASARLGEKALAELRESFVKDVLALPLSTVERAGTGDLITRTSRDVDSLARTVRFAVPELLIALVTCVCTLVALALVGPLTALPCLVAVPVIWVGTRWYLRRAPAGYLRENASYAEINDGLAETVEGARSVEALRLAQRRRERTDRDIARSYAAERYTLWLRTVWFPTMELGYVLPVVATLGVGGTLYLADLATIGQVTAATLYVQQLIDPLDRLLMWIDELQVGGASLARLLGVAGVPPDRTPTARRPSSERITVRDVRFGYADGPDVLHGVSLDLRQGERLAMVGPSGAGKSTLGRLLAGVHGPRSGGVSVGGVPLTGLPLEDLRGHVALVTQEHHVFRGTVRDNVAMVRPGASDAAVRSALEAVDAWDWVAELPSELDTHVGAGGRTLPASAAQQLALARLVLADPHTLVLDEATSLLDPRAARRLERSLGGVLDGRTVVAIAHRLHTAHDADRVAVVEDGRIAELGPHEALVNGDGTYAALWRHWHG